jgi:molybdopterin-guanine dinucleotide biosynthesis protein B
MNSAMPTCDNPFPPVLGLAAFSGTGKTTLLTRLIPLLRQKGLRLGLIKHSHHAFEIDKPGKDSYALRQAGADQVLVASSRRTVLMTRYRSESPLPALLKRLSSEKLDLILVEGFKHHPIPKIELHRSTLEYPLLCLEDKAVIALATDAPLQQPIPVPVLNLNDAIAIAYFILEWLQKPRS